MLVVSLIVKSVLCALVQISRPWKIESDNVIEPVIRFSGSHLFVDGI